MGAERRRGGLVARDHVAAAAAAREEEPAATARDGHVGGAGVIGGAGDTGSGAAAAGDDDLAAAAGGDLFTVASPAHDACRKGGYLLLITWSLSRGEAGWSLVSVWHRQQPQEMENMRQTPFMAISVAHASSEVMLMRDLVPRTPTMTSWRRPQAEIPSLAPVEQMMLAEKLTAILRNMVAQ